MRVIKANTTRYVSFYKSLPLVKKSRQTGMENYRGDKSHYYTPKGAELYNTKADEPENNTTHNDFIPLSSGKQILEEITGFISLLNNANTIQKVNQHLYAAIKNHFDFIEADFFFFDTNNTELLSPDNSTSEEANDFINNAYREGILDWTFGSKLPKSIPLYNSHSGGNSEDGGQYLIIPLFEGTNPKGIFSILHNNSFDRDSASINYLQALVGYASQRINLLAQNQETRVAYNSLQAYQSKLSNDYRLYAVGELAGGVLEEILNPLQVIFSSVDLLHGTNGNSEIISSIKNQVRKIESSAERLRRFADRNDDNKLKIIPCDMNKIIENYYAIISSSLEKKQIECILDLEPGLPSILTHPDLINQLLVNILSMITADLTKSSGIIIQTQLVKDIVRLTFINAGNIPALKQGSEVIDPNLKIIHQLVKRHEGEIEADSDIDSGSRIEIKFPLKRKIRS